MDESIIQAAERLGFLDATRLAACRAELAKAANVAHVLAKTARLSPHQVRAALLLARYDRARADDLRLGSELVRTGAAADTIVRACLTEQGALFDRCEPFPPLAELLARRGLSTLVPRSQSAKRATTSVPVVKPGPVPAQAGACKFAIRRSHAPRLTSEVAVIDVSGALEADAAVPLRVALETLISDGTVRIALNAEKLDSVSDEGLEALQGVAARCRDAGGDLRLCVLSERVRKMLDATPGAGTLQLYENERGAVNSFKYL